MRIDIDTGVCIGAGLPGAGHLRHRRLNPPGERRPGASNTGDPFRLADALLRLAAARVLTRSGRARGRPSSVPPDPHDGPWASRSPYLP